MDKYEWRRLKKIALRKQTLQTVGLKKTKQNENEDSKNRFFSHPVFEFSSSDKEIEEKVKKIENGQNEEKVKKN